MQSFKDTLKVLVVVIVTYSLVHLLIKLIDIIESVL